jgi:hypothetical protein
MSEFSEVGMHSEYNLAMSSLADARVLCGVWKGVGRGCYPTMPDFAYDEELTIAALGAKPVMSVAQKTFKPSTKEGMHFESGFLRFPPSGSVEMCISHPFGVCEVYAGALDAAARTLTLDRRRELDAQSGGAGADGRGLAVGPGWQ